MVNIRSTGTACKIQLGLDFSRVGFFFATKAELEILLFWRGKTATVVFYSFVASVYQIICLAPKRIEYSCLRTFSFIENLELHRLRFFRNGNVENYPLEHIFFQIM